MKLYHGSRRKLNVLIPQQGKGITKFENKKAIFLCKTFKHAALYAIGKTLKGKTAIAVLPNKLVIVEKPKLKLLKQGYVYEVDVKATKGPRQQYAYKKPIKKFKVHRVNPKDYEKYIVYIKTKEELFKLCKINF